MANLEECVLLLGLELVGSENFKTARSFLVGKAFLRALKKLEHILNHNRLQVDLLLVVEVLSLELDLRGGRKGQSLSHVKRVVGSGITLDMSTLISASEGCDERLFGAHDSKIHTSWFFFLMSEILVLPLLLWCSLLGGLNFFDAVSLGGAGLFLFCVRHFAVRSGGFVGEKRERPF